MRSALKGVVSLGGELTVNNGAAFSKKGWEMVQAADAAQMWQLGGRRPGFMAQGVKSTENGAQASLNTNKYASLSWPSPGCLSHRLQYHLHLGALEMTHRSTLTLARMFLYI